MTIKTLLATAALLAAFAIPAFATATHDVPWYATHASDRANTLAKCQANPGDLANSPDCINAAAADRAALISGL